MKKECERYVSIAQQSSLPTMHTTLMHARSLRGWRLGRYAPYGRERRGAIVLWHRCHLASVSECRPNFRVKCGSS